MMGHKKFIYKNINDELSPIKSINRERKLITLVYKDKDTEEDNCWKILSDYNDIKGESGHYLEAFFGKIEDEFVIHLLLCQVLLFVVFYFYYLRYFTSIICGGLLQLLQVKLKPL